MVFNEMKLRFFLSAALGLSLVACGSSNNSTSYVREQVAPNPNLTPVIFNTTLTQEKYTGMQVGAGYNIDTVVTTNTLQPEDKVGGDLSQFGKAVCTELAKLEGKPLLEVNTPATVGYTYTPTANLYRGSIHYFIGEPIRKGDYASERYCRVRYELSTNKADNTLSKGFVVVSTDLLSSSPIGLDADDRTLTGGDSASLSNRSAYFEITGVQVAQQ
jgi:hypothetical protein